ncbi:MAG: TAXI family TRAP transporter solute-binding subunit [Firmicutes bacterium]|nr:TAXI family TRAP transporter solute-binding subunit [Bacillota bacterium]
MSVVMLVAIATGYSVFGSGCVPNDWRPARSAVTGDDDTHVDTPASRVLVFATGEISGAYNRVGSVLASLWSRNVESLRVVTRSTGGSMANLTMLSRGEVDVAFAASNSAYRAFAGQAPFKEPVRGLRAVAALYPEVFQFIARKESTARSISDLKGLRVAVGSRSGGTHLTFLELLKAHHLDPEDMQLEYLSFSEAVFAMQANMIDVAVVGAGIPTPAIEDMAAMFDIKLLEVDPDRTRGFIKTQPYLTQYRIPAGTYRGVDHDILTIASPALLVTTDRLPDGVVYALAESMFGNVELLRSQPHCKNIQIEAATRGLSIPLHPGAERYYRGALVNTSTTMRP